MDLLAYFRVLRRRWWVIAVCVLLGVGLGWASTQVKSDASPRTVKASRTYYKATHIFLPNTAASTNSYPTSFTNLDQMALLATTGPVPDAVAKQLGGAEGGQQLAEQITTLTNGTTGTLAITAVDPNSDRAVQLADAFADQLVTDLAATDLDRYNQANKDATDRVNFVQGKIDTLIGQIGTTPPPPNVDVLQAQLHALENQSADAFSSYQDLAGKEPPASPLATLQKAQSVPIGADEYSTRLRAGELGQNNLQAGGQAAIQPGSSSSSASVSLDGTRARVFLGAFLGLLVGVALALLMERLDRRIRTRADAEAAFGVPVLADVPVLSSKEQREHVVVAVTKPLSPAAEAYRAVRSSLLFQQATLTPAWSGLSSEADRNGNGAEPGRADGAQQPLVVMITSPTPKDGKTTSSANLAAVFAEAGSSVLVLNCDFRRPMIHEYFGVSDEPRRVHRTAVAGVKVVSNVTAEHDPNPAQVIAMQRQLIAAARSQFDVVILDTAPLLSANDGLEMATEADFVVLVARAGSTKVPAAQRGMEMLERVEAPVVGSILVEAGEGESKYYAYYGDRSGGSRNRRHRSTATHATNGNGSGKTGNLVLSDPGAEELSGH